ncbi:hypothetical protein M9H77_16802 [Catharanthus roseus]|uniref:Uncharacterized protein n=1 Tax=Catharanthus roseus TaxID=4058 RepID=A0ACC0B2S4_CATRO|nr:hypothetical protein M9H77_16802 [Catharanthus roseus]
MEEVNILYMKSSIYPCHIELLFFHMSGLQKAFHDCRTRQSIYQLKEQLVSSISAFLQSLLFVRGSALRVRPTREEPVAKSLEELPSLSNAFSDSSKGIKRQESEASLSSREQSEKTATMPVSDPSQEKDIKEPPVSEKPRGHHHKRTQDTLAAAEECFLARKKAKKQ